jgi:trehalose 6-phosphate phosphatase
MHRGLKPLKVCQRYSDDFDRDTGGTRISSKIAVESESAMTPEAAKRLRSFSSKLRRAASPVLLLDYDGTLAPFRVDRFKARPWAGVRELLTRIQSQGRTRMAVITGRPAAEIAPLLRLERPIEVWGLHGAERIRVGGRRELDQASPAALRKLDELRAELRRDSFGGLFEDKANGVVMHWRGVSPSRAREIEAKSRMLFTPLASKDGLALLDFEAGIELRAGRDKGGAVDAILEETGRENPVAFLGDDFTDEAAFRAVDAVGEHGLSVLVRRTPRATEAQIWLRPPVELRAFLEMWVSALNC